MENDTSVPPPNTTEQTETTSNRDVIQLDVGGTLFKTRRTNLSSKSTYFRSCFLRCDGDDGGDENGREDEVIFIDQDPDVFSILLSFMRTGAIEQRKITTNVLLQAEFFGVDSLLNAAKCLAFLNLCGATSSGRSEEEIVAAFDEEYGGTREAISAGILPSEARRMDVPHKKEYASLTVFPGHNEFIIDDNTDTLDLPPTCCVELKVPAYFVDPSSEDPSCRPVPNCITFLDALNWLHRHGFTVQEEDFNELDLDVNIRGSYRFSRPVVSTADTILRRIERCIVFDQERSVRKQVDRREFAAVLGFGPRFIDALGPGCILANVGEESRICRFSNDVQQLGLTFKSNISKVQLGLTFESNISKGPRCDILEKQMAWLQSNGYTRRETGLEAVFSREFKHAMCSRYDEDAMDAGSAVGRLYSRPLSHGVK